MDSHQWEDGTGDVGQRTVNHRTACEYADDVHGDGRRSSDQPSGHLTIIGSSENDGGQSQEGWAEVRTRLMGGALKFPAAQTGCHPRARVANQQVSRRREGSRLLVSSMMICVCLLVRATYAAAKTSNQVCQPGANCSAGPALRCLSPQTGDFSFQYVLDGNVNICRCPNSSWAGPNCNVPCPGGAAPCSLKGECLYADATCACDSGRVGKTCELTCPMAGGAVCGGKGTCVEAGGKATCSCISGWRGAVCTVECQGGAARPCRARGTCEMDGSCTCLGGWRGADCSLECPGSSLFPCSLNGKCTDKALCECDPVHRGFACEFLCPSVNNIPCGGRGVCNSTGVCNCNKGFRGTDCMLECAGGVQNPCTGHGTCLGDATCSCSKGWAGARCTEVCPGGLENPCSGHGTCVVSAKGASCTCDQSNGAGVLLGYAGEDCSTAVYNPRRNNTTPSGTAFREKFVQKTEVAFSTISPLLVFVAIMTVICTRLYTQIREAKQAEIDAINRQIAHLSRPLEE